MHLYGRRSSINVLKVIWTLAELGLIEGRDYSRIDAGLQFGVVNTPGFLALNPNGLVPTLVDGEQVLWESNTIMRYLASSCGDTVLLPEEPAARADVERWMDWQLGTFWATLRVAFLGLARVPEADRDYAAIKASHREAARLLRIVDRALGERLFLAQHHFTLADIGVAIAAMRWFQLIEKFADVVGDYPDMPSVDAWLASVTDRPAYRAAVSG